MEDEDIAPNTYVQLIQSVYGQKVMPVQLYFRPGIKLYWRGFLSHTDWISCMYLPQYPRLPFCVLFFIQLIILYGVDSV